jgi:hypothetical protein
MKERITRRYMVELKQAPFSVNDATLVPQAGSCKACPKRAGNNRDEYPDARADVCTDTACYHAKCEAQRVREPLTPSAAGGDRRGADAASSPAAGPRARGQAPARPSTSAPTEWEVRQRAAEVATFQLADFAPAQFDGLDRAADPVVKALRLLAWDAALADLARPANDDSALGRAVPGIWGLRSAANQADQVRTWIEATRPRELLGFLLTRAAERIFADPRRELMTELRDELLAEFTDAGKFDDFMAAAAEVLTAERSPAKKSTNGGHGREAR